MSKSILQARQSFCNIFRNQAINPQFLSLLLYSRSNVNGVSIVANCPFRVSLLTYDDFAAMDPYPERGDLAKGCFEETPLPGRCSVSSAI